MLEIHNSLCKITSQELDSNRSHTAPPPPVILRPQIIINKKPSVAPSDHKGRPWAHYNMKGSPQEGKDVWDVKKLLEVRAHKIILLLP